MPEAFPLLRTLGTRLAELVDASHRVIAAHQHPGGAYPASPTFSAYQGFSWFRDGAFIAEGMSRHGDAASAARFHDWCTGVLVDRREQVVTLVAEQASGVEPSADRMLPARFTLDGRDGGVHWWDFQLDGYGTWLWAVLSHTARHGADPGRWTAGIDIAVDYLCAFWTLPCYDWWEEQPARQHVSTLGAISAGLGLASRSGLLTARRFDAAVETVAQIARTVGEDGMHDGHLTKWLGSPEVDASLLACVVPFGLVEPGSPAAARTIAAVVDRLVVRGGTHRYAADEFYGGGQWPLLTCLLGWNLLATGDVPGALTCLTWVANQATADGDLPEQVGHHLLAPEHRDEWVQRWGPVATPLLWSHGMYLILADELGLLQKGQRG